MLQFRLDKDYQIYIIFRKIRQAGFLKCVTTHLLLNQTIWFPNVLSGSLSILITIKFKGGLCFFFLKLATLLPCLIACALQI